MIDENRNDVTDSTGDKPAPRRSVTDRNMWLVGIASGLIVYALTTWLLPPLQGFVGRYVVGIISSVSRGMIDSAFADAPRLAANTLILNLSINQDMLPTGAFCGVLAFSWILVLFPDVVRGNSSKEPIQPPLPLGSLPRFRNLLVACTAIALVQLTAMAVSYYLLTVLVNANVSFQQRMTILESALNPSQHVELESQWMGVKTEADYRRLMKRLDSLANATSTNLPPSEV